MADQVEGVAAAPAVSALIRARQRSARSWAQLPIGLIAIVGWIPGGLVFFRAAFTTGFDTILGDNGDARLVVVLHEHWVDVFRGRVSWRSPPFFFPVRGTLGYSDTFLLNQVFYAPFRAAGFDQFLAFEWTFVALSIVGFTSMFVLLRRVIGTGWLTAWMLSSTFAFANNLYIKAAHPQLYSIYWIPLLVLVFIASVRAERRSVRIAWGALGGFLFGSILFSTFYVGWFTLLAATVFGVVLAACAVLRTGWRDLGASVRRRAASVLGFTGGASVPVAAFLVLYVPILRQSGGRRYEDAMFYAPRPTEVINVGPNNFVWGPLTRRVLDAAQLQNSETSLAITPILLVLAIVSGAIAWRAWHRRERTDLALICLALAVTVVVLTVLPLRFGIGSLWRIPWTIVPGASGIRAIDRLQVAVGLLACVTVALGVVLLGTRPPSGARARQARSLLVPALLGIGVVEQVNVGQSSFVDRSDQIAFAVQTPDPPPVCRLFFVIDSADPPHSGAEASVDALLIAQHVGLPTVNGYSGQYPKGYLLADPTVADYELQVRNWVVANHVEAGLCSYDIAQRVWTPTP